MSKKNVRRRTSASGSQSQQSVAAEQSPLHGVDERFPSPNSLAERSTATRGISAIGFSPSLERPSRSEVEPSAHAEERGSAASPPVVNRGDEPTEIVLPIVHSPLHDESVCIEVRPVALAAPIRSSLAEAVDTCGSPLSHETDRSECIAEGFAPSEQQVSFCANNGPRLFMPTPSTAASSGVCVPNSNSNSARSSATSALQLNDRNRSNANSRGFVNTSGAIGENSQDRNNIASQQTPPEIGPNSIKPVDFEIDCTSSNNGKGQHLLPHARQAGEGSQLPARPIRAQASAGSSESPATSPYQSLVEPQPAPRATIGREGLGSPAAPSHFFLPSPPPTISNADSVNGIKVGAPAHQPQTPTFNGVCQIQTTDSSNHSHHQQPVSPQQVETPFLRATFSPMVPVNTSPKIPNPLALPSAGANHTHIHHIASCGSEPGSPVPAPKRNSVDSKATRDSSSSASSNHQKRRMSTGISKKAQLSLRAATFSTVIQRFSSSSATASARQRATESRDDSSTRIDALAPVSTRSPFAEFPAHGALNPFDVRALYPGDESPLPIKHLLPQSTRKPTEGRRLVSGGSQSSELFVPLGMLSFGEGGASGLHNDSDIDTEQLTHVGGGSTNGSVAGIQLQHGENSSTFIGGEVPLQREF